MKTNPSVARRPNPKTLAGRLRTARATGLLLLALFTLPAVVRAQFTYTTTNGTITITGYTGPGGAVTIPDMINGLTVTSIGYQAFYNGYILQPYILTSITIPDSVTNIGALAFAWCNRLSAVTLGNGLVSIGSDAFASCSSLASITIPNSVTSIGDYAFTGCWRLTSVTIPSSVTSIGDYAFADCGLTEIYFQGNAPSLGGSYVFQGDNNIVYYWCGTTGWGPTFGGRPTAPWSPAGGMCTCTTNNGMITITGYCGPGGGVTIPGTINSLPVTSIGSNAFYNCWNLTSVTIPDSVISIEDSAFRQCENLTSATIPNSVVSIGDGAFDGCSSLTNVTIPNSVISIGTYAFSDCYGLTSVTIPNSVTSIGNSAFYYCTSLTNVTIPGSVTYIGNGVFSECTSLTNVLIPASVTNLEITAFGGCPNLAAITVDALNLVYSSVDGVLFNKSRTTLTEYPEGKGPSYTIPNGTTSIGEGAFDGCSRLTNATIPNGVRSIGDSAFEYCYGLTSVTIPNSVTNIGNSAFYYCTSLTNVTISNGVTTIGDAAFDYCTSLTGVYFAGNAPSLGGWHVFTDDPSATVYYLPGTSGWGATFGGRPTALWFLPNPLILTSGPGFGVQSSAFGFIISWATNLPVVVEACTNLANHSWSPVQTNALTGGWSYFSDPQWANYPGRFYRLRSP